MLSALLLAIVVSTLIFAIPVQARPNNANPNKLEGAQTYLLNMLGKKSDWGGQPAYDSERRTMFVPEDVEAFLALSGYDDVKIWVEQGSDFAVTDPNAFDDGECSLTIGPGKYEVYFVALGKPKAEEAILEGWVYNATADDYLLYVGEVRVKHSKKPVWMSGHDIFWVSPTEAAAIGVVITEEMWIFDFLDLLAALYPDTEYLYLWKLVSSCKHIQVRFYKIG